MTVLPYVAQRFLLLAPPQREEDKESGQLFGIRQRRPWGHHQVAELDMGLIRVFRFVSPMG